MFRALFIKELREIWWLGLLPLGFMLNAVSHEASYGHWLAMVPRSADRWDKMPFSDTQFPAATLQWGCILAAAIGLWQIFRESQSRTWHFLLHRPINRQHILGAKVLAALTLYAVAIIAPALGLIFWASTPGTHSSPFHWWLTLPTWYALAVGSVLYLAGIFAGLRRGHLLGTRWWPLVGASVVLVLGSFFAIPMELIGWMWVVLLVWNLLLAAAVRTELEAADFN